MTSPRATIWIVEDEAEICCLFSELLTDFGSYYVVCVDDSRHVKAKDGDVIFLDLHGTKAQHLQSNGATVITMSGDMESDATLKKPFDFRAIQKLLRERIARAKLAVA